MFTKFSFIICYEHYNSFFLRVRYVIIISVFRCFFIINLNITEAEIFKVLRKS